MSSCSSPTHSAPESKTKEAKEAKESVQIKPIKKALIPAAGLGTRFLPVTKTVPKEMLPIVDKPTILFIVEEAVRAGAEDIVLIAGRNKEAIDDFFDCSYELQDKLHKEGKIEWLEMLQRIQTMANVISIRQKQALGLGHAVYCGRPVIGDSPFAVLLGDEIMLAKPGQKTVTEQLASLYQETGLACTAMMEVPRSEVRKYGIVDGVPIETKNSKWARMRIQSVVEKPNPESAPSNWALPGRYVFTSAIFNYLKDARPGKNGEIQLTDGMHLVAQNEGLLGTSFDGIRYDVGDKLGFLKANIELALEREDLGDSLRQYLRNLKFCWAAVITSLLTMLSVLCGFYSSPAEARLPETSTILSRLAHQVGGGFYILDQDVEIDDSVAFHEKWIVESNDSMRLIVSLSNNNNNNSNFINLGSSSYDKINSNNTDQITETASVIADAIYKGSKKIFRDARTGDLRQIPKNPEFTEELFFIRSSAKWREILQQLKIPILTFSSDPALQKELNDESEYSSPSDGVGRNKYLARTGGTIAYTFGQRTPVNSSSSDNSVAVSPTFWIAQDSFVWLRLRFPSGAEIQADDFSTTGNLTLARQQMISWNSANALTFARVRNINVKRIGAPTPAQRKLLQPTSLPSAQQSLKFATQVMNMSNSSTTTNPIGVATEFYGRFR